MTEQDLLQAIRSHSGAPETARALATRLGVSASERASFRRRLKALVADGALVMVGGRRFALPDRIDLVTGRLQGHAGGFAFVLPDTAHTADVFIPESARAGAMHGDRVVARIELTRADGRREGRVTEILERRSAQVVGQIRLERRGAVVTPFDARLDTEVRVAADDTLAAVDGDMVTVEIQRWPGPGGPAAGRVVEVLGRLDDPGVDTEIVLRKHGIPDAHAPDAVAEARGRDHAVAPSEIAGRTRFPRLGDRDHRRRARPRLRRRDLDRAAGQRALLARRPHRRRLALRARGQRARPRGFARGTSVYFPERAVHMFPSELATGVCSLNPHVDRLVQSCLMEVDGRGEVVRYELHDGVIHSRARMTYTAVNAIVTDRDPQLRASYAALVPMFERMHELFEILNGRRRRRGSIDFDLPEAEVVVDDAGAIEAIVASERNVAHRLIEEFMLLANETVAAHLEREGMPALYRVHETPDPARVDEFEAFVSSLGFSLAAPPGRGPSPSLPASGRPHPRHAGGAADRLPDAAHDAEGALRRRQPRPLRPGGAQLHAFHVADPPLSRPGRAPRAARAAARRRVGGAPRGARGRAARGGPPHLGDGAPRAGGRARAAAVEEGAVHGRQGRRRLRPATSPAWRPSASSSSWSSTSSRDWCT